MKRIEYPPFPALPKLIRVILENPMKTLQSLSFLAISCVVVALLGLSSAQAQPAMRPLVVGMPVSGNDPAELQIVQVRLVPAQPLPGQTYALSVLLRITTDPSLGDAKLIVEDLDQKKILFEQSVRRQPGQQIEVLAQLPARNAGSAQLRVSISGFFRILRGPQANRSGLVSAERRLTLLVGAQIAPVPPQPTPTPPVVIAPLPHPVTPPSPIVQPTPQPAPQPPPPASVLRLVANPANLAAFLAQPATPATRAISVRWTAPVGVLVDAVVVTYTWFCAAGLKSQAVNATLEPDSAFAIVRWFASDQPVGCAEGVFPPSGVVITAKYRINRAGPADSVSLVLPGSLPPPPAGTTALAPANSFDAAAYPYVTYVASCFAGVGRPATKSSLQTHGGPCMGAARTVATGENCGASSGYTQSSLLQSRLYLNRCLADNSTGHYRNNYRQDVAGYESQIAAIDACPAGYTRTFGGPCVRTGGGSGGSTTGGIYELGGRQVNPYTPAAYFETNCLQIASASAYKLAYTVYGATYFQQSLHATRTECEAAGKAWVANKGKTPGSTAGSTTGSGGNAAADGSGTSPAAAEAAKACASQPYLGSADNPQVDTLCKLAQFDACLHKATGLSTYDSEGRNQCKVIDGLLRAIGGNWSCRYCPYPY